eukprot:CAMPEP_0194150846 /NCGR_PEP_ID=MMETSP0152-20130528/45450_1 /TAXON_ID=1049557 /ORGANISM="Thalassiothrix antarctica, Strain L6-D1" /LENGTH=2046 /DNA_ID=CAMNT_0038854157 /DNA_START=234 /DNA_END=6374 /DNA_ORIENTATION=-
MATQHGDYNNGASTYFADEDPFEIVMNVDTNQLKNADHDEIKLRNLPTSYQLSGEDPEAGVIASPSSKIRNEVVGGVDDLIGLTHLNEPAILHALRLRYDSDIIYTSTGPILIAVNPFKLMDLYSVDVIESYRLQGEGFSSSSERNAYTTPFKRRAKGTPFMHKTNTESSGNKRLPPHVYQIADDAYRAMMRGLENDRLMTPVKGRPKRRGVPDKVSVTNPSNQAILVSGESGAGKTVTTKFVLNYLAALSKNKTSELNGTPMSPTAINSVKQNLDDVSIEQQVLRSNPVLESFGNARTIRNDNSSRFGKYIDISFTKSGKLSGAFIETYLLEKVRLIHPAHGERNYHVFYQFLSSATASEREEFYIDNLMHDDFHLLAQSATYDRRDGVNDEDMHQEMLDAMITIGFESETVQSLMRLIIAVLFAGNITFTPSKDGESCILEESEAALKAAALLGISFESLASALTVRTYKAGMETVTKQVHTDEAIKACEALIKAVYGAAFDFIVDRVNASIVEDNTSHGLSEASIGVLDIFGFETFKVNSFEQICINYTNEALQQQFNKYVFKLEQQEYEKEGILWKFITFPDNQDVLDLIDKKHTGIIALLDEQCILPRSSDEKFTRYLYARCDKHPRFHAKSAQRVDYKFSVEHYAGLVEYTTESWLEKNKDQLPAAAADLLNESDFGLIGKLRKYVRTEARGGRGSIATKSVGTQFSSQLKTLRARIDQTVPHYIRCLKPNDDLTPDYFEPLNIVEQLRCGGVLEAVRVSRAGYPTRYPHDVFMARYYILGDHRDTSPVSPIFSPDRFGSKESELKRIISKIAFDLWYADHQVLMAALENEQNRSVIPKYSQHTRQRGKGFKSKMVTGAIGAYVPPYSLAAESSVRTPEEKNRNKLSTGERKENDTSKVARPENAHEFLALDFSSRCAVAGLQLGRTKVFLRREAFDSIESLRSEKFFSSAATIQKHIRGRQCRNYYLLMRAATIMIQSIVRMWLAKQLMEYTQVIRAVVCIQSFWRKTQARINLLEIYAVRDYAASVIQNCYRNQKLREIQDSSRISPGEIIYAVSLIQAMHRGRKVRRILLEAAEAAAKEEYFEPDPETESESEPEAEPSPIVVEKQFFEPEPEPSPKPKLKPISRQIAKYDPSPRKKVQMRQFRAPAVKSDQQLSTMPKSFHTQALVVSEKTQADLFKQIEEENWSNVEHMLDRNPELAEAPDPESGELPLHMIARHSGAWTLLIDMVLVLYPKALIHRDKMGALPVHHAAAHDNLAALEIIHNAYQEGINDVDKKGRLPLHVAAEFDAVDTVKFLLSKSPEGAYTMVYRPPNNSGGGLPLHIACRNYASIGVITALLAENFASAKRTDENGDLPIHLLLRCGEVVDQVVIKTLLTCFSSAVSRTDMNGDLPLAIAIKYQCRAAVINTILMQFPEAAGVLNGEGHSPLFLAFKHTSDDRTIMGLLNHAPELATAVDRKTGLLPIQVGTENEHSHFIVHNLLKRDMPVDLKEKVKAQLVPHHYSWNHIVTNTEDLYHQVVTKVLQSCTQPQVLALAHVEGPDGKIALAAATPVCKHEIRVMLRLFNTLEVVNQRPAYTNPVSDTQIFYALRYDPPKESNGQYTVIHEDKGGNDFVEDCDDTSQVSSMSRNSLRSTLTSRSQQSVDDKLRFIRKEKGQQVIAKLTSRADIVERELKVRKEYHLSRHYVPAIISVHHTVQHAAYSEAMAEPGYCITMEGADTTAENLMLDMRKSGKPFPLKALKRIGISLLHMHEHGIIHGDFGTHNIGKFGSRWKLLGVGGSIPIGEPSNPNRGFYHPTEAIVIENNRAAIGKKNISACVVSIPSQTTYDIWAYGVVLYEAVAGVPLSPYSCRGKRPMTSTEIGKIGLWDDHSVRKALRHINEDDSITRNLITKLLHPNPELRFQSMRAILEHPFFGRSRETSNKPYKQTERGANRRYTTEEIDHQPDGRHNKTDKMDRPRIVTENKESESDSPIAEENRLNGVAASNNARNRKPGLSESFANGGNHPVSPDKSETSSKRSRSFGGIRFRRRVHKPIDP